MRQLTYLVASTLDGFIAGPDASDPTGPQGFWPIGADYVAQLVADFPETLPAAARAALGVEDEGTHFDTAIEGRRTYETGLAAGVANAYPHLRHLVVSRTLTPDPGSGVELVAGNPVAAVRALKREPGRGIWLIGGGELAGSLLAEIDRIILKLSPLSIGSGVGIFGPRGDFEVRSWRLAEHTVLEGGVVFLTYERAERDQQA